MEAYLDNSATTRCLPSVAQLVCKVMTEDYGNPSSRHLKGVEAERYLTRAREEIARTLKVQPGEIYFTSGGTESDNWALIGGALANRRAGNHLITTAVEHAAILQPMAYLQEQGFEVTFLPVDHQGAVSLEALKNALRPETILVSMMYVNNELGTLEPVAQAAELVKKYNPRILFHTDAIQAYGKYRIYPKRMGIDLLSVSGHKIHGPKGTGFLYAGDGVKLKPLILGGGQQKGMRSGTDNVPGCAGLGLAAREAYTGLEEKTARLWELKTHFVREVAEIPGAVVQGQSRNLLEDSRSFAGTSDAYNIADLPDRRYIIPSDGLGRQPIRDMAAREDACGAPHIVSVSFRGIRSEVLLHALEEKGVYISSGSACSSNKKQAVSGVLKEAGVEPELLDSTVRFSFCTYTTMEEIDYALAQLRQLVPMLQKYRRR